MKRILLWDPRFPDYSPLRVVVSNAIAAAVAADGTGALLPEVVQGIARIGGDVGALPDLPTIALVITPAAQAEGQTGTTAYAWTATLVRNGSTAAIPYAWSVAGAGANPADAADFGGAFPGGSGTFAAGETIKTGTILVTGDQTVELDESFLMTFVATGVGSATANGTILNDDVPGPTAKPLAPTVVATNGNGQTALAITDNPSSQQVRKWGIYEYAASGDTPAFQGWAYTKEQLHRRFLSNGSSRFYKVSAWNALGESPLSAEVSASAAATNLNPLRLAKVRFFLNTLFYAQLVPDFRPAVIVSGSISGTVLTVTSGAVTIGATVALANAWTGTTITSQLSGTANGAGTYQLSAAPTQGNQGNGTTFYLFPTAITVSVSDGTALSTKPQNGAILVYGTYTVSAGKKTISYTETIPGGASNTSTQPVDVVARPAFASYAQVRASALAIKACMDAKPTYAAGGLTITDMGSTMPAGYTASNVVYPGKGVHPAAVYTSIGSFMPFQYGITGYDPVEKVSVTNSTTIAQAAGANNGVLRISSTKRTIVVGVQGDAGLTMSHFRGRFSDNDRAAWNEADAATHVRFQSGAHYFKLDGGSVPASRRVNEMEFSSYSQLTNGQYVMGFGYEAGDTPQVVVDTGPVILTTGDSYNDGVNSIDKTRNSNRTMARQLGVQNLFNLGKPSYRYTLPVATQALGVDAIGGNVLGIGDLDMSSRIDLWAPDWTINDNGQGDFVQLQAMLTNALIDARYMQPGMGVSYSLGFWPPQYRNDFTANHYNAVKAAFADASGNGADKGMRLNDGIALGWAVPAGATGSSPYFAASASQSITASVSGSVLTVTAGSGIEAGFYLLNSSNTWLRVKIIKQLSGTTGGTGTYQLDAQPNGGDIASTTLIASAEDNPSAIPIHLSPTAGQEWMGLRKAEGVAAWVNDVVANAA